MKRLIMMLMAFCLIVPMANAELTKKLEKAISKIAKGRAKQLEKDGYSIMDSLSLRNALEKHLTLLEKGAKEQIGIGHSNSVNDGRKNCLTYAIAGYASKEQFQFNDRSVKTSTAMRSALPTILTSLAFMPNMSVSFRRKSKVF